MYVYIYMIVQVRPLPVSSVCRDWREGAQAAVPVGQRARVQQIGNYRELLLVILSTVKIPRLGCWLMFTTENVHYAVYAYNIRLFQETFQACICTCTV